MASFSFDKADGLRGAIDNALATIEFHKCSDAKLADRGHAHQMYMSREVSS